MELSEAIAMIRPATGGIGGTWADFGAGSGLFSRALSVLLEGRGRVVAVDRDARALRTLEHLAPFPAPIETVVADVRAPDALRGLRGARLDGAVFANVLHYLPDPVQVLRRLAPLLAPAATLVVVEYDVRGASRWVPYPLPPARLGEVVRAAGLGRPDVVARRPSAYRGTMYCARLTAAAGDSKEG